MITAIVQARMGSTRLPGKILTEFSGDTLLGHIINRVSKAKLVSKVVVATSTNPSNDQLITWLDRRGIQSFRGSENDVLNRYYGAAKASGAAHIARITADDPFKDPEIIDAVGEMYLNGKFDFAYNNKPPSFAEGLDTEIFSFAALEKANANAVDPFEREHVTQHFYRNPRLFKQKNYSSPLDYSHLRWTIDTPEDLVMAKVVYENLYTRGKVFVAKDILELIERKPEIPQINQDVKRSDMYKKQK
ncbi:MAG: glycosyltransferase family protein [Bacteroidota bacterium]